MAGHVAVEISDARRAHIQNEFDSNVDLSLVIPTFNEAGNIDPLIQALYKTLVNAGISHELIVVDDNSPDRTWKVAESLIQTVPTLRVLRRMGETGLATAVVTGWAHSTGKILGVIDGDGQHPPEVVIDLLRALDKNTDVALASRHLPGGGMSSWSTIRRLLSRGAQALGLLLLPGTVGRVTDPMSGFFLIRRKSIAGQPLHPVGYKILIEVLARGSVRKVTEVPFTFLEREQGKSKVRLFHYFDYLRHLMRLRIVPSGRRSLARYLAVTFTAVAVDMTAFLWLFDGLDMNLTRSAALSGEIAILYTVLLLDLWTFAGRAVRTILDRVRRLLGVQLALGVLLFARLLIINSLVNWFHLPPFVAFILALSAMTPVGHLLGSRLTWKSSRS